MHDFHELRQVPIGGPIGLFNSLQILPLDQAFYTLLHHRHVGKETGVQLLDDLGNQLLVVELFALPAERISCGILNEREKYYFIILTMAASMMPPRVSLFFFSVSFLSSWSSTLFMLETTPILILLN